jgi:ferric-dicitrate binding protein FerR (iron transport regulator)
MHRLQRALAAVVFPAIFLPRSLLHAQGLARLYSTEGTVEARPAGGQAWAGISQGKVFIVGEAIRTADSSRAALVGADGVMVRLNANALLEFKPPAGGGEASIHVDKGDAHFLSRDPHNVPSVTTSLVSGSIRGTEFTVSVRDDAVTFSVINGAVNLSNQFGSVALSSGEEGLTEPGKAPVK